MQHPSLQPQHLPRRVIIHLDLDCFYCQVEQKRLSIPRDTPVAVQQWNGLIAVNYASRAIDITRHMRIHEALKLVPQLVLIHVETIGNINNHQQQQHPPEPQQQQQKPQRLPEADATGAAASSEPPLPVAAADGAAASPAAASTSAAAGADGSALDRASSKACLNRYRRASAEIMALLARLCPGCPLEKASIDEAYLDITAAAARELAAAEAGAGSEPGGDEAGGLAGLMAAAAAGSVVLGDGGLQPDREWDRLAAAGAVVAGRLRQQLLDQLQYTASAGIAHNKLLAKIASAANKPNQQTLVLPRAIPDLMQNLPLGKVKGLGGKLGGRLQELGAATAGAATALSWEQLVAAFDSKALWLYNRVRGVDDEPVTPRSLTQSLTSCKSFPGTHSPAVVRQWCGVLAEELADRLEEDSLDHGRTPRSLVVQYRGGDQTGSRDGGKSVRGAMPHCSQSSPSADAIAAAAFALFSRVAPPWPLNRLAISATDFVPTGGSSGAAMARFLAAGSQQRKEQQQREREQQRAAEQPSTAVTQQQQQQQRRRQHPPSSSSHKDRASQPTSMQLFLQPMQQQQHAAAQQPKSLLPSPLLQQQQQRSPLPLPQQQQQLLQGDPGETAGETASPPLAAAASTVEDLAAAALTDEPSSAADLSEDLAGVDVAEQVRLLRDIEIRRLQERGAAAKRKQAASSTSSKAGKKGRGAAKPAADGKQLSITALLTRKG